jgi:hypothetical protein
MSVASTRFSIYGYAALKKQLSRIGKLRLLLPKDNHADGFCMTGLEGDDAERRFRNKLDIAKIAGECADWISKKAEVKAVSIPMAQNLVHVENPDGAAIAMHYETIKNTLTYLTGVSYLVFSL